LDHVDTKILYSMHAGRDLILYLFDSAFRFTRAHGGIKEQVKVIKMFAPEIFIL
jgi:hypothetical protein